MMRIMLLFLLCAKLLWISACVRGDREELHTLKRVRQAASSSSAGAKSAPSAPSGSATDANPKKKLRSKLTETFLSNKLSAKDVFELAEGATSEAKHQSATSSVADFAEAGAGGRHPGNFARDILARLVRESAHELFWHMVPFQDPDTKARVEWEHPFLLPHELIDGMVRGNGLEYFNIHTGAAASKLLASACGKLGLQVAETIALGLHGDGVPYTKKESLEIISFNFLAMPSGDRLPCTAVSKKFATAETWTVIMNITSWSLRMLFMGAVSTKLPDGSGWLSREKRKYFRKHGDQLAGRALLLQVRGDWPFLRQLFQFPSWSSESICWKCRAMNVDTSNPLSFRICNSGAAWRRNRLSDVDFLTELRAAGGSLSPLLSLPGFVLSCVVLDWLHIVDLGVGADVIGNLFWLLITSNVYFPGSNKEQRLVRLWQRIRDFYKQFRPPSVLDNLTLEMIRREGASKKPKLKAKGGECRYLVPFAFEISREFMQAYPEDGTMRLVAGLFALLFQLQKRISAVDEVFDHEKAAEECRRFCVLYQTLQEQSPFPFWQMKPKVHLMEEMLEYQTEQHGNPRDYWTYRDESWCGYWAKASKRRGGKNTSSTNAKNFLLRFLASDALDGEAL
ncbi:unnamed protein product [Symbiodinium sp. CCMP2592]|nr:unnamed protein product [Symbiodinium sp. CCMP2592]